MDAFIANFLHRRDLGSGCSVFVDDRVVFDVWGGVADRRTGSLWQSETTAVIFSCTKGILAVCVYLLAQEGLVDLDAPVTRYWPDFGQHGKDRITVRDAMSHRSGLPVLDADLTRDQVLAWDPVIRAIEQQPPLSAPGRGHVYHAMTYGWIIGEIVRRITGQTPGRFLHSRLGSPLGLHTWIGLPQEEQASVAWMELPLPDEDTATARSFADVVAANPMIERALSMGVLPFPATEGVVTFNDPAILAAEIPGANGVSTPHSLARLYAGCVCPIPGGSLLTEASIADATRECSAGPQLSGLPDDGSRWGTGFQLSSPPAQPMLGQSSFGHTGAGGQLGFADLEHRVGFAYLSNQMGGFGDVRARELVRALSIALGDEVLL
ncbi:MAG: serine hydrolase domain-containing protein [Acidimicrobiia bacterium]|jgi:CubicO group peptidase (beta-lactamase class C family)